MQQGLRRPESFQAGGAVHADAGVRMHLLGRLRILAGGADITRQIKYRKGLAVLGYLAIHCNAWVRREQLASLLWPELAHAAALTNLRQVLNNLRSVLNSASATDIVRSDRIWVGLFPGPGVFLDVAGLGEAQLPGELTGEFLEGMDGFDSDEFEAWLRITRQHCRNRLIACMETQGAAGVALSAVRQLAQQDPLDERSTAQLMKLLSAAGARQAALDAYAILRAELGRELGREPGQELQSLRAHVLRAG